MAQLCPLQNKLLTMRSSTLSSPARTWSELSKLASRIICSTVLSLSKYNTALVCYLFQPQYPAIVKEKQEKQINNYSIHSQTLTGLM